MTDAFMPDAARRQHEEMGFHAGWNAATDQLETLANYPPAAMSWRH